MLCFYFGDDRARKSFYAILIELSRVEAELVGCRLSVSDAESKPDRWQRAADRLARWEIQRLSSLEKRYFSRAHRGFLSLILKLFAHRTKMFTNACAVSRRGDDSLLLQRRREETRAGSAWLSHFTDILPCFLGRRRSGIVCTIYTRALFTCATKGLLLLSYHTLSPALGASKTRWQEEV